MLALAPVLVIQALAPVLVIQALAPVLVMLLELAVRW
jgi:hypothetical protein